MACRGVHFALTPKEAHQITRLTTDADVVNYVQEEIEEPWQTDWLHETDKAWDAIHRALGDGTLDLARIQFPLGHAIFGGTQLVSNGEYFVVLNSPENALRIGTALQALSRTDLQQRYWKIQPADYGMALSEDDFEYTWAYFEGLPDFFLRAGNAGRSVIFTVDQ